MTTHLDLWVSVFWQSPLWLLWLCRWMCLHKIKSLQNFDPGMMAKAVKDKWEWLFVVPPPQQPSDSISFYMVRSLCSLIYFIGGKSSLEVHNHRDRGHHSFLCVFCYLLTNIWTCLALLFLTQQRQQLRLQHKAGLKWNPSCYLPGNYIQMCVCVPLPGGLRSGSESVGTSLPFPSFLFLMNTAFHSTAQNNLHE